MHCVWLSFKHFTYEILKKGELFFKYTQYLLSCKHCFAVNLSNRLSPIKHFPKCCCCQQNCQLLNQLLAVQVNSKRLRLNTVLFNIISHCFRSLYTNKLTESQIKCLQFNTVMKAFACVCPPHFHSGCHDYWSSSVAHSKFVHTHIRQTAGQQQTTQSSP